MATNRAIQIDFKPTEIDDPVITEFLGRFNPISQACLEKACCQPALTP